MASIPVFEPTNRPRHDLWRTLGIPSRGPRLYQALQAGLPDKVYTELANATGLDKQELARVVDIAPATLQRRLKAGRFNREESDRLYRLALVFITACDLFEGDLEATRQWLRRPASGLGGAQPSDMIATSAETAAVLDLIGRLEHGVFA